MKGEGVFVLLLLLLSLLLSPSSSLLMLFDCLLRRAASVRTVPARRCRSRSYSHGCGWSRVVDVLVRGPKLRQQLHPRVFGHHGARCVFATQNHTEARLLFDGITNLRNTRSTSQCERMYAARSGSRRALLRIHIPARYSSRVFHGCMDI